MRHYCGRSTKSPSSFGLKGFFAALAAKGMQNVPLLSVAHFYCGGRRVMPLHNKGAMRNDKAARPFFMRGKGLIGSIRFCAAATAGVRRREAFFCGTASRRECLAACRAVFARRARMLSPGAKRSGSPEGRYAPCSISAFLYCSLCAAEEALSNCASSGWNR